MRNTIKKSVEALPAATMPAVAGWAPDHSKLVEQAKEFLIPKRFAKLGKDRVCLQELLVYGLKGIAAYYFHALVLNHKNDDIGKFLIKALAFVVRALFFRL